MSRFLVLWLLLLTLTGCGAASVETEEPEETTLPATEAVMVLTEPAAPAEPTEAETEPQPERFVLTFAGDCTLGSNPANYYALCGFIKTVGEDYGYPFRNVSSWFENDDFTMVNLEGPLCDKGNPVQKRHTFRGPTAYTAILTGGSVEAVILANNHSYDYGYHGYNSTLEALQSAAVPYVENDATLLLATDRGLILGVYAMTYSDMDAEKMKAGIAVLQEQGAQVIIVAAHWGAEGTYRQTPVQTELAHAAIDAGAHIVYGSHPHVLQPVESYNGGVIFYSLGNFSFGGNAYPRDLDSALLQQEILRHRDGSVSLGELTRIPVSCSSVSDRNNFQPTPYLPGTAEYLRVMEKLDGTFAGPDLKIG